MSTGLSTYIQMYMGKYNVLKNKPKAKIINFDNNPIIKSNNWRKMHKMPLRKRFKNQKCKIIKINEKVRC